jgi:hypothetical protein
MADRIDHDFGCEWARPSGGRHSDAAKRIRDIYNLHRAAGAAGAAFGLNSTLNKIFAVALADGTSDGVLYDTRFDAIRHQHHNEKWYAYLRVERFVMSTCQADSMLKWHREAYDKGLVFVDRDDARLSSMEIIQRMTTEDHRRSLAALSR